MLSIVYPFFLNLIMSFQNMFVKSELLPFINNSTGGSIFNMFIMKHMFKTGLYVIILSVIALFFKDQWKNFKSVFPKLFYNKEIYKNKKGWFIILVLTTYAGLELINGYTYYNSLLKNKLNKFIIYTVLMGIIINAFVSYFVYNEKFNAKLITGYVICILGVVVVYLS